MTVGDAAPQQVPDTVGASGKGRRGKPADRRGSALAATVVIVLAGSALAGGLYDFSRWGLLCAALLVVLLGLLLAGRARSFGALAPAIAATAALAAWAAASMTWADSADRAWLESNRLVLYAAAFAVVAATFRTRRDVHRGLAIVASAIAAAALVTIGRLLAGDAGAFLDHRLVTPIGYTNATAGIFLMGIWPLIAVAERSERAWLGGAAMALAVVEVNLLVLTQSRGIVPALLVSVGVALAIYPGRALRVWALLTVAAGGVAAAHWTLAVYADRVALRPGAVPASLARPAALAALFAAVVLGAAWWGTTLLRRRRFAGAYDRHATAAASLALALVGAAVLVAAGDPVARVRSEWRAFTALQVDDAATTRFTGAGGYRHDLWRVALEDLRRKPLIGVGAGSYGLSYYQRRRQSEAVRQPHSLPLQIVAELGLVGGLLMLVVVVVAARALRDGRADVGAGIAGSGMAVAWAAETSVDWLYNLPGVTCIAIVGLVAASGPRRSRMIKALSPRVRVVTISVLLLVAAASLGRLYAARTLADRAGRQLARDPVQAVATSSDSLALDPFAPETYYTRAAAFARLDDYARAKEALMAAAAHEPRNFVPQALLGDLAVRRGDIAAARAAYARALRLNPRDPVLAALAADPRHAL